jgi:3-oxoacyl-[acyl-carrier protein] reductase
MELAPRVRVNSVAPGIIEGRMIASMMAERGESWRAQIPLDRFGTPADVAKAICFLASDRASYINGAVLNVNGGMFMD